jgi:hypothetical protein
MAPEKPDQRADDDQQVVVQREAGRRRRPARVAVEHRDDHRHVGAADGDDQGAAEREGQQRHQHQREHAAGHREVHRQQRPSPGAMAAFSKCWPANLIGAPDMMPCSLAKAITEPVKVMAPMTMPADSSPISTALSVPAWRG